MGNDGSDLISSKPTTSHKENDRQAEANNQERSIDSAEYLFDKQRRRPRSNSRRRLGRAGPQGTVLE
jgi:hypothetical protein